MHVDTQSRLHVVVVMLRDQAGGNLHGRPAGFRGFGVGIVALDRHAVLADYSAERVTAVGPDIARPAVSLLVDKNNPAMV